MIYLRYLRGMSPHADNAEKIFLYLSYFKITIFFVEINF
jgi:hypothetical protein